MKDLPAIKELLASPKEIVITTHANPDADALGSSLGWYHFLKNSGHSAQVITPTPYPNFLDWMPGNESVVKFSEENAKRVSDLIAAADLIFCLDFSGLSRIKRLGEFVGEAEATKIIVDHHQNPEDFASYMIWDTKAAATAELIFEMIVDLGDKNSVTKDIADCLYAGLMTDTGSFKHSNTTSKVHRVAAELIECGARSAEISHAIYDTNSLNRLRFLGYALNELLEVNEEMGVAHFAISAQDTQKYQLKQGDTEGLVNYALSIEGIVAAALFKEVDDEIKISFRSFGDIEVNKFAEEYFNGGGHRNAAGGHATDSLEIILNKFRDLVNKNVLKTK